LILSSLVTIIGFSTICGGVMLDMRHGAEELARQSSENLASGIDADISRNLELYDLSLRTVVDNLALPEVAEATAGVRRLILFDHAATARHFGAIQVFDSAGNLTLDAATPTPAPENRAGEDYFAVQRDRPDGGLYVSRPKLHRGAYAIVLSRRLEDRDGRFLGAVVGSIRISYFHDLFGRLRLGPDDSIQVFRRDGTIIMRRPFDLDVIGRDLGRAPLVRQMLAEPTGWYSGPGAIDGIPRLYVWRDATRPLMVVVGRPWVDILDPWRRQAVRIGVIMLGLAVFLIAVTLVLVREIGRRARAEESLEQLATTDALTGLTNRRKFDAMIDIEWRRALRQGTPVALLMIDADHFKSYNDRFGHLAGDQMLVGIGGCIAASVRRAGECAARYGGEEFAVLLPGHTAMAALEVAETIRAKVEQWSAGHSAVTVSIGVASLIPSPAQPWATLVEAADRALYAAKEIGRNRSVVAPHRGDLSLVA
jgi:diguanylate cyclase (GGDEF)-like protein